jgi:hypothetical protein
MVNTKAAFDGYRYVHCVDHLLADRGYKMGVEHQLGTEAAGDGLLRRTAAVEVHFIVSPLLSNFGSLCHFGGFIATNLTNYGMLVLCKFH